VDSLGSESQVSETSESESTESEYTESSVTSEESPGLSDGGSPEQSPETSPSPPPLSPQSSEDSRIEGLRRLVAEPDVPIDVSDEFLNIRQNLEKIGSFKSKFAANENPENLFIVNEKQILNLPEKIRRPKSTSIQELILDAKNNLEKLNESILSQKPEDLFLIGGTQLIDGIDDDDDNGEGDEKPREVRKRDPGQFLIDEGIDKLDSEQIGLDPTPQEREDSEAREENFPDEERSVRGPITVEYETRESGTPIDKPPDRIGINRNELLTLFPPPSMPPVSSSDPVKGGRNAEIISKLKSAIGLLEGGGSSPGTPQELLGDLRSGLETLENLNKRFPLHGQDLSRGILVSETQVARTTATEPVPIESRSPPGEALPPPSLLNRGPPEPVSTPSADILSDLRNTLKELQSLDFSRPTVEPLRGGIIGMDQLGLPHANESDRPPGSQGERQSGGTRVDLSPAMEETGRRYSWEDFTVQTESDKADTPRDPHFQNPKISLSETPPPQIKLDGTPKPPRRGYELPVYIRKDRIRPGEYREDEERGAEELYDALRKARRVISELEDQLDCEKRTTECLRHRVVNCEESRHLVVGRESQCEWRDKLIEVQKRQWNSYKLANLFKI
jgi:hypothetical protein